MGRIPDAFRLLYAKRQSLIKPGLDRVLSACSLLGGLASATPSVVIGGTNGKGSTAGMLWRLYAARGERVGLFTSPHLISFSERIRITDIDVTEALIEGELALIQKALPPQLYEDMSFFELTTVLALKIFRDARCSLNILEVGLGGRLDSTNIGHPLTTAIVSIGMDHMALLGNSPAAIAREKCGILRAGSPVFWGGRNAGTAEADQTVRNAAAAIGAPFFEAGVDFSWDAIATEAPEMLRNAPEYLRENFAMAAAIFSKTQESRGAAPDVAKLQTSEALRGYDRPDLPWPPSLIGRFQHLVAKIESNGVAAEQPLLLDVCHNVDGARVFVRALKDRFGAGVKLPGLISMMRDKDTAGIIDILKGVLSPIMLFRNENERSAQYEHGFDAIWRQAQDQFPSAADRPWVVCGSVMAVGEVLAYLGENKIASDCIPK